MDKFLQRSGSKSTCDSETTKSNNYVHEFSSSAESGESEAELMASSPPKAVVVVGKAPKDSKLARKRVGFPLVVPAR